MMYSVNSIEKALKNIGIEYKILSDGEIAINSPYVSDTTFDCRINVEKGVFHDFESDEGGRIEKLIGKLYNCDIEKAKKILYSGNEIFVNNCNPIKEQIKLKEINGLPKSFTFEKNKIHSYYFNIAKSFLLKKMVDYSLAKKYNLRWTEKTSLAFNKKVIDLSYRIIIPSFEDGKLVYFQARDYTGKSKIRYKNPPKEMQSKKIILPFYDNLKEKDVLFISEGPWEAIQYSGTYMLGPRITKYQIEKIKRKKPSAICIIPDNDETGKVNIIKNGEILKNNLNCEVFVLNWWKEFPQYKDPIEAGINSKEIYNFDFVKFDKIFKLKMLIVGDFV